MARKRRIALIIVLLTATLVASLNFALVETASNPTGRYFSSEILRTGGGDSGTIAEEMLSADLKLPRNDSATGETLCFCGSSHVSPPGRCDVCVLNSINVRNYRIPDFITSQMIIEAKARSQVTLDDQLRDFIEIAAETGREFWLYVRLDTIVTIPLLEAVESTGGNVVRYFVVEGYTERLLLEQALHNILLIALLIAAGIFVWDYMARQADQKDDNPEPPQTAKRAEDSTDDTEEYMRRMERLSKRTLHDDDQPENE